MYNDHSSISLPPMICWIFLWNYGGFQRPPSLQRLVMNDKIIEQFELITLVTIFISSVYAISPVV